MTAESILKVQVVDTEESRLYFQQVHARDLRKRRQENKLSAVSSTPSPSRNVPSHSSSVESFDRELEISRLEYQEKYCREVRMRKIQGKQHQQELLTFKEELTAKDREIQSQAKNIETLRNELQEKNDENEAALSTLREELLSVQEKLSDKDQLNKALVQELVEATEKFSTAETKHTVSI